MTTDEAMRFIQKPETEARAVLNRLVEFGAQGWIKQHIEQAMFQMRLQNFGAAIQRGFAFGPNAIGYASAGPVEPRVSANDNYGETLRLIWIAYEGHGVLDNRFVVGIRST